MKFKKITSTILILGITSVISLPHSFADSDVSQTSEIQNRLQTSPAKYEYTSRTSNFDKNKLWKLKTLADRANSQNSKSSYVSLASYLLGLGNMSVSANVLGGISYMIQSDLDAYGTLSYAFTQYRYLDTHPKVKTVRTRIPYKRFFNGNSMTPWYPHSKPYKV